MSGKKNNEENGNKDRKLRDSAEDQLARRSDVSLKLQSKDTEDLVHELRVHQTELEMQNEELQRAQGELEAARSRYFDLYNLAPVGYITLSEQGLILEANLTAAALLGVVRGALVKQPISRFILKEDQDIYYRHGKQLFESGEPQACELRMVKMDGMAFWVRLEATIVQDAAGSPVCLATLSDITERKQAEMELRESEERFKTIFNQGPLGIALIDSMTGHIRTANPMFAKISGRTMEETTRIDWMSLTHPDDVRETLNNIALLNTEEMAGFQMRMRFLHPDDTVVWISMTAAPLKVEDKLYPLHLCMIEDITMRKQAEESLLLSEENFRRSLNDSPLGVRIVSDEGELLYANRAILAIFGYESIEELSKSPVTKRYTESSYAEFQDRREKRCLHADNFSDYDIEIVRKDGEKRNLQVWRKRVLWNGKEHYQVIYRDITDHKRMEDELREGAKKYRELYDFLPIPVYEMDLEANITSANHAIYETFGGTEKDLAAGFNAWQLLSPDNIDKSIKNIKRLLKGEKIEGTEYTLKRMDGSAFPAIVISSLIHSNGNPVGLRGAIVDITKRKETEKQLQDTLESLRKAVDVTIQVMGSAVEARDPYTAGHQIRSSDLARTIATEMGLPQDKIDGIRMAGSIHDIGKLSIPAEILSKPTELSKIEFALIKEHACQGYNILKYVESSWPLAEIVYQHHERIDGSGYPRSLKGDDILIEARILAVADVVEAMASHRPYCQALGINAAMAEIEKNRGTLYDEAAADACLRLFKEKGFHLEGI